MRPPTIFGFFVKPLDDQPALDALRREDEVEVPPAAESAGFEDRQQRARAADGERRLVRDHRAAPQSLGDLAGDAFDDARVGLFLGGEQDRHDDDDGFAPRDGRGRVGRGAEPAGLDGALENVLDAGLVNGRLAGVDGLDDFGIGIAGDDVRPPRSAKTQASGRPIFPGADHRDIHKTLFKPEA